jgi:hypothetical protein
MLSNKNELTVRELIITVSWILLILTNPPVEAKRTEPIYYRGYQARLKNRRW